MNSKEFMMRTILAGMCVCVAMASAVPAMAAMAATPAPALVKLYPVVQGGKWGYIDKAGKVAIKPQWGHAWGFREGLARVQVDDLRGFIDAAGKMVIEPKYFLAWDFHEGLAAVMVPSGRFGKNVNSGKWCYINRTGKIVIKPLNPAKWAEDFHEGKARYKSHGSGVDPSIYINRKGRKVSGFLGTPIRDFYEGLAAGRQHQGRKLWGYRDHSLKFMIKPQFGAALDFADGLAPVMVRKALPKKDKRGHVQHVNLWGYIDKTGKIILEPKFQQARPFSEGLAAVRLGGKWGCIDKTGKVAIKPAYNYLVPFSEGLARAVVGGKSGYIDKTGKLVVEPKFDVGWNFSKGLARIEVDGKLGYIDKTGKYVWEPAK